MYYVIDNDTSHTHSKKCIHLLVQVQWNFIIVGSFLWEVRYNNSLTVRIQLAYVMYGKFSNR